MDSRERTLLALDHKTPDRIPIDFWASRGFIRKLEAELDAAYEEFLDAQEVDLRYIAGPRYVGPPLGRSPDGSERDIWGVPRRVVEIQVRGGVEQYAEVTDPPLADAETVAEVESYEHWPSADWFSYDVIEEQCEEVLREGRVVVLMGDRVNRVAQLKPATYLRGDEEMLTDMAARPEIAHAILRRIRRFYLDYLGRILEAAKGKIDIVLTGDDFGSQHGMLVSPAMWEEYLGEGFAEYLGLIKSGGARTMHHSCGSVAPIIPRMVECGLDILQSVQPEAEGMSLAALKARYGSQLCFHGGVSIQRTMPYGTREDVRAEVKRLAEAGGPGGGYVFCTAHNIQADTPVGNVQALMEAYHEYGRY